MSARPATRPVTVQSSHLPSFDSFNDIDIIWGMSTMTVEQFVNAREAAAIIGCTDGRVRQLLLSGELEGVKANERAWLILRCEAERMRDVEHGTGRPRKLQGPHKSN